MLGLLRMGAKGEAIKGDDHLKKNKSFAEEKGNRMKKNKTNAGKIS